VLIGYGSFRSCNRCNALLPYPSYGRGVVLMGDLGNLRNVARVKASSSALLAVVTDYTPYGIVEGFVVNDSAGAGTVFSGILANVTSLLL